MRVVLYAGRLICGSSYMWVVLYAGRLICGSSYMRVFTVCDKSTNVIQDEQISRIDN